MKRSLIIALSTVFWLAACGGGGGGRSSSPPPPEMPDDMQMMKEPDKTQMMKKSDDMQMMKEPDKTQMMKKPDDMQMMKEPDKTQMMKQPDPPATPFAGFDFTTQGPKSSAANARDALQKLRESGGGLHQVQTNFTNRITEPFTTQGALPVGNTLPANMSTLDLTSLPQAAQEVDADKAWAQGWTGKGVKLAIVDDFDTTSQRLNGNTHGDIVRAVAWQIAPEAAAEKHHINLSLSGSVDDALTQLYGRAKGAFDAAESSGAHIVNASFGVDPYTHRNGPGAGFAPGNHVAHILQQTGFNEMVKSSASSRYDDDMLFVLAAGNGARRCTARHTDICTIEGAALVRQRQTDTASGDRLILVGALADGLDKMAVYSYTAGALMNDFIVAHDNIWQGHDGAGTSFAAPKVSGAAALVRHKFPNLNGPQLKQVLLQSADDLGQEGPDATFGYGKLNVLSALSPLGGLTPNPKPNDTTNQSRHAAAVDALVDYLVTTHPQAAVRKQAKERLRLDAVRPFSAALPSFVHAAAAAHDTRALEAWKLGWTGKGVKVGHLDDFDGEGNIPLTFNNLLVLGVLPDTENINHGEATRLVTYQVAPEISHTARQLSFGCNLAGGTQSRQTREAYQHFSDNGVHIVNNSFSTSRWREPVCPNHRFSAFLVNETDWQAAVDRQITDAVFLNMAAPQNTTTSYDPNMLFVFSAGNDGANCAFGTGGCNLRAASILKLRADGQTSAGERVLFVGSLADGQDATLADYSARAGTMQNDYIVAHDDVFSDGVGAGTSFAAPRVTGAAALVRHKWPSLNGANLKQVLLRSADDIGATGVDEVFGYGRLNIMGALSPLDGLTQ